MELYSNYFKDLELAPNVRSVRLVDAVMGETERGYNFDGIAAPTGRVADLGQFTEEYASGSFRRFLAGCKDNIPFLHEHNPRDLLATTRSGRLRLEEDGIGLRVRADVVKTDLSERIKALVDVGDIAGMSIGMVVGRGNAEIEMRDGRPHRLIRGFKRLLDVCTTFDPAYVATEAQFRSMSMQYADSPESLQQLLMGAYPQLQEQGNDTSEGAEEETATVADQGVPDGGDEPGGGEGDESGAVEKRLSAAAATSRLLLMKLELEGGHVP